MMNPTLQPRGVFAMRTRLLAAAILFPVLLLSTDRAEPQYQSTQFGHESSSWAVPWDQISLFKHQALYHCWQPYRQRYDAAELALLTATCGGFRLCYGRYPEVSEEATPPAIVFV